MHTIGLIGGMSWESTALYYRLLNEGIKARCGGLHSAPLILHSVDFAEIAALQHDNNWPALTTALCDIAKKLEQAGAKGLLICTNTMHKVAANITEVVQIPVIHIGDAIIAACKEQGYQRVALLGTAFTMEQPFLKDHLSAGGLDVMVPDEADRRIVHQVIYDELCQGKVLDSSRQQYQRIIEQLKQRGAQAVILGCTEIGLLIAPQDSSLPVLDTTELHANSAVDFMLSSKPN